MVTMVCFCQLMGADQDWKITNKIIVRKYKLEAEIEFEYSWNTKHFL